MIVNEMFDGEVVDGFCMMQEHEREDIEQTVQDYEESEKANNKS